ncbi:hypothetical protein M4S82_15630 [Planococcus sp. MERTA32b]|nr:hypothetical protein [Planococcus sp. MER TA 32b]
MSLLKKHKQIVESLEETLGYGWALLKYPKNKSDKAIYKCNAAHVFNMQPKVFENFLNCPVCEIDHTLDRKSLEYKLFMKDAKEKGGGVPALGEDTKTFDVHHIYSMRMFPEVAYHPSNSILLNRELHKDYHRYFSPYNTNGYTFFAWIKLRAGFMKMDFDKVKKVKTEVLEKMNEIEYEISKARSNEEYFRSVEKLTESITDKKLLTSMEHKASRLAKKINHGETLELVENEIILLNVYDVDGIIHYRNDFGNWIEFNPISGSILKNVYEHIMAA